MANPKPLTDADGEVRGLTTGDFKAAVPFSKLPASLQVKLGVRGPQRAPTKVSTTIRLSPEVVDFFRSSGDGWQSRMDGVLREYVARHGVR